MCLISTRVPGYHKRLIGHLLANIAMTDIDGKHGLTEKEYADENAHTIAARGHVATDQ